MMALVVADGVLSVRCEDGTTLTACTLGSAVAFVPVIKAVVERLRAEESRVKVKVKV
jgi:hypothetical protein